MTFRLALSGLNAAQADLTVTANNIANTATNGFKGSRAVFADVYARSLQGAGANNIGIGTKIAAVQQEFTQGNISVTKNPLDLAINGRGFFRFNNNGEISYSRNGQLNLDANGYIVNSAKLQLTGYALDTLTADSTRVSSSRSSTIGADASRTRRLRPTI